jgi:hypothetical protein
MCFRRAKSLVPPKSRTYDPTLTRGHFSWDGMELEVQEPIVRRTRTSAIATSVLVIIAVGAAAVGFYYGTEAQREKAEAQAQKAEAEAQKAEAERERAASVQREAIAQKESAEAKRQSKIAEEQKQEALKQTEIANAKTKEADEQRKIAEQQAAEAKRQAAIAEEQRKEAQKQQQAAEGNTLHLSSSIATTLVNERDFDGALLTIQKAAKIEGTEVARDTLYAALFRSLSAAHGVESYKVSFNRDSTLYGGKLYYENPDVGSTQVYDPVTGATSQESSYLSSLIGEAANHDARPSEPDFMQRCSLGEKISPEALKKLKALYEAVDDQFVNAWDCARMGETTIFLINSSDPEYTALHADGNEEPATEFLGMPASAFPSDIVSSEDGLSIAVTQGREIHYRSRKKDRNQWFAFEQPVQSPPDQISFDKNGKLWAYFINQKQIMAVDPAQKAERWYPAIARAADSQNKTTTLHFGTCVDRQSTVYQLQQVKIDGKILLEFDQSGGSVIHSGVSKKVTPIHGCFSVAADAKRAVISSKSRSRIHLVELAILLEPSIPFHWVDPGIPEEGVSTAFFVDEDLIVASQNRVLRLNRSASGEWNRQEIYSGDREIMSAEPNRDGSVLLIREFGGNSFVYSARSRRKLFDIGDAHNNTVSFTEDGRILVEDASGGWLLTLPALDDLVDEIPNAVSGYCNVVTEDIASSPCWPANRAQ